MSEFKIHHHVSELMNQLGIRSSDSIGEEVYTERLLKNTTPYITTQTKEFLAKNAIDQAKTAGMTTLSVQHDKILAQIPESGTKMTAQELSEIKDRLLKEANAVSATTMTDFVRKALKEKEQKQNLNIPLQPDWLFQRPSLTLDFMVGVDGPTDQNIVALGTLPVALQENAVADDLLCCMQGIEGKYILARALTERYAPKEFMIDQSLDPSLHELVRRILPLCSNYSTVVRFIEEKSAFEYGLVNHALSAAMRSLIKDYMVLVAQLEHQYRVGQLSLQKMWFYLQPTMRTLDILASIANSINRGECIGGAVLSLLHEKTSNLIGDAKSQELCLYLTQSHYTICRERIPVFLEQVADKILNTGKYLNVVRLCGRDVNCPHAADMVYTLKERRYYDQIEQAYDYASKLLLELLMREKELMARIRSIKHYFLLDKGDFIVQFMDMTEEEMRQNMDDILSLRTSTANVDPFKDDLKVDLLPFDLITQLFRILTIDTKQEKDYRVDPTDLHLSGLESFSFDYVVKWPVSLVVNRKALTRYQMLFRHLFYCKHVERQLCSVWVGNKVAKTYSLQKSRWYSAAFALRQRMLNFVQNFEYYMMFEVIEPNWHLFQQNMDTVSNVDDVLVYHTDFLNSCLKDCMLTNPDLLKIVHKLMMVCVTFSNFVQRLNKSTILEAEVTRLTKESTLQAPGPQPLGKEEQKKKAAATKVVSEHVDQLVSSETFERTITNFDTNFSKLLLELLDKILDMSSNNYDQRLSNIIYRLDFNGFYTERLEEVTAQRHASTMSTSADLSNQAVHDAGGFHSWMASYTATQRPDSAHATPSALRSTMSTSAK
ncbi:hypothetical protein C0Q70_10852 [Pomacea canaliculata]|uniref:Gamma-tubulin complex component n=1 Tax=Pomacea canaliculata TaxID=400727 RepID=A0A2T7P4B5_POMCA|nr:hypothetical protein C0Q70_10852 [Pomacea canaliculata]